jgi:DnaJ-class molecular chaperone
MPFGMHGIPRPLAANLDRDRPDPNQTKQRTMKKTAIVITLVTLVAVGIAAAFSVKCSFCNGTGWRGQISCTYCGGDGDIGR